MSKHRTPDEIAYDNAEATLHAAVLAAVTSILDTQGPTPLATEIITRLLRMGDYDAAARLLDAVRTMETAWDAVLFSELNVTKGDKP